MLQVSNAIVSIMILTKWYKYQIWM
jgi:hypothetical protein